MKHHLQGRRAIAVIALLGCGVAHAALLPADADGAPAQAPSSTEQTSLFSAAAAPPGPPLFALAPGPENTGERKFALASAAPAGINTGLWAFILRARSQQQGDSFLQLENQLQLLETAVPAQVPLPGALWLLVMGLLGLAGVRFGGTTQARPTAGPLVTVAA